MRRTKPHPKKEKSVAQLKEHLSHTSTTIVTDYRGLTVQQLTQLRRLLEPANVEYHIAKNTLLRLAASQSGYPDMAGLLEGPTGVAFAFGDETSAAKVLVDFARTSKILRIKGGVLGGRVLSGEEVGSLATAPPKKQLFAQVLGTLQSPATSMLGMLNAPTRSLLYLLQARAEQLESQAGT